MSYTVYFGELDRVVQEAINYLLEDNLDSLTVFEGLSFDDNYEDEEEVI